MRTRLFQQQIIYKCSPMHDISEKVVQKGLISP